MSWTKIGATKIFYVFNNDSPAELTPQSVSVSSSRRKSGAKKITHLKQTEGTSAVRTSGIITTMTLTL